jgi:hypothetical protein
MEPDEALEEIRQAIRSLRDGDDPHETADTIASHFEELDDWLCKGKHLPEDWAEAHSSEE